MVATIDGTLGDGDSVGVIGTVAGSGDSVVVATVELLAGVAVGWGDEAAG